MKRHNYKNLKIWKLGIDLVDNTFEVTKTFPKEEKFGLISQINRSSISIPSNIAEGSSFELETQLIIALKRKYISEETFVKFEKKIAAFQKMTMSFQNNL
jgi:hypothetical protein